MPKLHRLVKREGILTPLGGLATQLPYIRYINSQETSKKIMSQRGETYMCELQRHREIQWDSVGKVHVVIPHMECWSYRGPFDGEGICPPDHLCSSLAAPGVASHPQLIAFPLK